jgi:hypothetical protein
MLWRIVGAALILLASLIVFGALKVSRNDLDDEMHYEWEDME